MLLEFEDRTRNLTDFQQLISDESFKQDFATALGFKQDGSAYTVDDVNALISSRLDAYVSDWGLTRNPGNFATATMRIFLVDATPVSWSSSSTFTSSTGATYNASSTVSNVVPNLSATLGQYYVDIPITASASGSASNATAGAIRTMSPKPATFSYCTNTVAATGGSDQETDLDLINRASDVWSKRVNGSIGALERLADVQTYVSDFVALDADNETDKVYLGSVCDIWTQFGTANSTMVEEFVYWPGQSNNTTEEQFDFVLQNQPLDSSFLPLVYRYDLATGLIETQVDPSYISLIKDTNTYQGSVKAMDTLHINMIHNTATYQRKLRVLYLRDQNPQTLQNVFDDADNRMIGPKVLVKNAVNVPIRVIAVVKVSFGYDTTTVQNNITANIETFFNGGTTTYGKQFAKKKIGEDINHTDIGTVILRTEGVVSYDANSFYVVNTLTGDLRDPLSIKVNEYATLFDVLFTYNSFNLSNFTASAT
jgi:hypothetical protein